MRNIIVAGYAFSAVLYALAWWNPSGGTRNGLVQWVTFPKLGLTEFLSLHAATMLGGFVLATHTGSSDEPYGVIFWLLLGFYLVLALGAYNFHRNHRALLGFYLLLAIRCAQFFSLGSTDPDIMRSEVLKNFSMTLPFMALVTGIFLSDDMFSPWQNGFLGASTLWQRIWRGKPILFVSAYYLLWAVVELKWPVRMSQ